MNRRFSDSQEETSHPEDARFLEECIANLRRTLSGLKYGSIIVTVHEGRVVQIDVTEKLRLKPS
jgi:hypothetical protein